MSGTSLEHVEKCMLYHTATKPMGPVKKSQSASGGMVGGHEGKKSQ